ncbi:Uncharacterised protein [Chryseobacterium nakagawai]|uniref:Uncharacterized protein n=1 Tax=Chryseobacterium nakagawai TaxID=1241982 RepID=A0AAD1DQA2_CHRNA|nr:hypothetical protein [Chryseobacterium nakagawai]AZA91157.1 hypothetical protein EG343_11200 [Chryseobacterium nakagawai]VEH22718.1 Uncharacterised protein [Chryseobacterium nakagawai]
MTFIHDIYNYTFGNSSNLLGKSFYHRQGNKLVRFADHNAKHYNIEENNEGIEELLLVYVNANLSEKEMQNNVAELEDELNISVDYIYFDDEDKYANDINFIKDRIEFFLK